MKKNEQIKCERKILVKVLQIPILKIIDISIISDELKRGITIMLFKKKIRQTLTTTEE